MGLFNRNKKQLETQPYSIGAPVKGEVIDIKETKDMVFNTESLGKGVGIIPKSNQIIAPIGGVITTFFPTKHAVGITTDEGIEVLIHIGIDTVELNGKFFTDKKKQGDRINRGEELLNVEFEEIMKSGYETTVLMVIVNTANNKEVKTILGNKEQGEIVIEIEA